MTKEKIYEKIVELVSEVKSTGVTIKLLSAVENLNEESFDCIFEDFKEKNSKLYNLILDFGDELNTLYFGDDNSLIIFGDKEDERPFETKIIDGISFYIFTLIAEVDEKWFFDNSDFMSSLTPLIDSIDSEGYVFLAEFIEDFSWSEEINNYPSLYHLLVDIFEGEF